MRDLSWVMAEPMKAWQCVGCGRIDHPQPCIGVCRDQKIEIVYATDYRALEDFVRRVARITPRGDGADKTWKLMQEEARRLLSRT